jgi:hypothetical protein
MPPTPEVASESVSSPSTSAENESAVVTPAASEEQVDTASPSSPSPPSISPSAVGKAPVSPAPILSDAVISNYIDDADVWDVPAPPLESAVDIVDELAPAASNDAGAVNEPMQDSSSDDKSSEESTDVTDEPTKEESKTVLIDMDVSEHEGSSPINVLEKTNVISSDTVKSPSEEQAEEAGEATDSALSSPTAATI